MTYEADDIESSMRECLKYTFDVEYHDCFMKTWHNSNEIMFSNQEVAILFKHNNNFSDFSIRYYFVYTIVNMCIIYL